MLPTNSAVKVSFSKSIPADVNAVVVFVAQGAKAGR